MSDENQGADAAEETQGLQTEDSGGFSFDMSQEKASSGFPLIPNGTYPAAIESVDYKISSSANPMWQIKWGFLDGELAQKNRKISSFTVFNAEQRGRAKMFLKRVAPELSELTDFNPKAIAEQQLLVGKHAKLKINNQTDKQTGEERSNVADVLAIGSGGGEATGFSL